MSLTPEQQQEIAALREQTAPTRRAVVPALEEILYQAMPVLEEILYQPLPVLDRGFVRVIDYMGDDAAIGRRHGSPMAAAPSG